MRDIPEEDVWNNVCCDVIEVEDDDGNLTPSFPICPKSGMP